MPPVRVRLDGSTGSSSINQSAPVTRLCRAPRAHPPVRTAQSTPPHPHRPARKNPARAVFLRSRVIRLHVRYLGRVQGVGFRATARSIAAGFAVTGNVRNLPDGSVDLHAQGDAPEVRRFLDALAERMRRGITHAHETPAAPIETEQTFDILR